MSEIPHHLTGRKVSFQCPICKAGLKNPLSKAGEQDSCPQCGANFTSPGVALLEQAKKRKQEEATRRKESKREKAEKKHSTKSSEPISFSNQTASNVVPPWAAKAPQNKPRQNRASNNKQPANRVLTFIVDIAAVIVSGTMLLACVIAVCGLFWAIGSPINNYIKQLGVIKENIRQAETVLESAKKSLADTEKKANTDKWELEWATERLEDAQSELTRAKKVKAKFNYAAMPRNLAFIVGYFLATALSLSLISAILLIERHTRAS